MNVKVGTCENMYYARFQDFKIAFESGHLVKVDGSDSPSSYFQNDSGYRFRFPFPWKIK